MSGSTKCAIALILPLCALSVQTIAEEAEDVVAVFLTIATELLMANAIKLEEEDKEDDALPVSIHIAP
jgi:hypothetical protein